MYNLHKVRKKLDTAKKIKCFGIIDIMKTYIIKSSPKKNWNLLVKIYNQKTYYINYSRSKSVCFSVNNQFLSIFSVLVKYFFKFFPIIFEFFGGILIAKKKQKQKLTSFLVSRQKFEHIDCVL